MYPNIDEIRRKRKKVTNKRFMPKESNPSLLPLASIANQESKSSCVFISLIRQV